MNAPVAAAAPRAVARRAAASPSASPSAGRFLRTRRRAGATATAATAALASPTSPSSPPSARARALARLARPPPRRQQQQQQHHQQQQRRLLPPPAAAAPAAAAASAAAVSFDSLACFGLFPASGLFGVWAALALAGAFGRWAEHRTRWGRELSGALVATLAGMALSNLGVIPHGSPELHATFRMLVPVAVPLLLLGADLRRVLREAGRLLGAFLLGAACTAAGTLLAAAVLPLGGALGDSGWRVAAALLARHIGGAVNYVAVSGALDVPASLFGAGLAADDLILTCYFAAIYALARRIPPDPAVKEDGDKGEGRGEEGQQQQQQQNKEGETPSSPAASTPQLAPPPPPPSPPRPTIAVYEGTVAMALSLAICHFGTQTAAALGCPSQALSAVTALSVAAATLFPRALAPLAPSGEGLAAVIMQTFFAAVGASADVGLVVRSAPVLFAFSAVALAGHLGLLLALGRALGFSRRELLLASNANIGGPTTVAGMAAAKGWRSSLVPAVLVSTLGYALGSGVGMGTGYWALRPMMMVGVGA